MKLLHNVMIKPHHIRTTLKDNEETTKPNEVTTTPNEETTQHNAVTTTHMKKAHKIMINNHIRKLWLSICLPIYVYLEYAYTACVHCLQTRLS